ncbi:MAG: ankyrin repeat domain-containing protein, partial [Actinopolymorphaceae bacterium]
YTRPECAEFLIDAGAVVDPSVGQRVIRTGASVMLRLLWAKGVLPPTLPTLAALGDLDGVRTHLDAAERSAGKRGPGTTVAHATVVQAFLDSCRFAHAAVASLLLDRCVAFDADLGDRIDRWQDRAGFVAFLCEHVREWESRGADEADTPWRVFVVLQLIKAVDDDDAEAADQWFASDPVLLGESGVDLQVQFLERAAWTGGEAFVRHLLARQPAILDGRTPPPSSAIVHALEYGNAHLVPLLTRIWPLPDDLPHAAGVGDLPRVRRWFDPTGRPVLGNPHDHYPGNSPRTRANLGWNTGNLHQVLDVALAWACMNGEFEVASFLLDHGADINTSWATHEPASILHECVLHGNRDAVRFLVDHGADLTIRDHRYHATAEGWARHAAYDEAMADYLAGAERARRAGAP